MMVGLFHDQRFGSLPNISGCMSSAGKDQPTSTRRGRLLPEVLPLLLGHQLRRLGAFSQQPPPLFGLEALRGASEAKFEAYLEQVSYYHTRALEATDTLHREPTRVAMCIVGLARTAVGQQSKG